MKNNNIKLIEKLSRHGTDVFLSKNVEIKHPDLVVIGSHIAIDSGFKCSVKLKMGDYIHIGPDVVVLGSIRGYLQMADFSGIAAGSIIVCGSDNYLEGGLIGPTIPRKYLNLIFKPVIFERFAVVGVNCSVMPGVILGEGSVVGAHSLVMRNTEPWTFYLGNPAKPLRMRDRETVLKYAKELGYL